jgi:tRNA(Leu) C34 or U34 (ribose-2'-O)-methylase TrmL
MRNFKKDELGVVNVQGKILPFKGSGSIDIVNTDSSDDIVKTIKAMAKKYKIIVVDDFQYVMANEFMRRATERGYDKFTEIAKHAWDVADCVRTLPADVIVYVMCHTDTDQDGFEKLKTIGKLLDEKIVLEGMSTIVLKTAVSDGQYMFLTQNNGKDTVKSPEGMFPAYAIDNDLKYVDEKIRSYYELGEFLTDEEMKEKDAAVAHDEVAKEEPKKRSRSRGKKEEEKPTETPEEKTEAETAATDENESGDANSEMHKRSRRRGADAEVEKSVPETDASGNDNLAGIDMKGSIAVVIGSEGEGMANLTRKRCDFLAKIPMKGKITSLNASVTCGMVIYEVARQRG